MPQTNQEFVKQVFQQYHQELHGYLVNRLRGHSLDAADIAQETYLRLLRMKNTDVIENPHAYVYRVAGHVWLDYPRPVEPRNSHNGPERQSWSLVAEFGGEHRRPIPITTDLMVRLYHIRRVPHRVLAG